MTIQREELRDIESKIRESAKTYPEIGTFDWIISIDTSDEEYIYSTKDIKFLNYSKSIKEAEEKIETINENIADVKKNLEEIEKISNELKQEFIWNKILKNYLMKEKNYVKNQIKHILI